MARLRRFLGVTAVLASVLAGAAQALPTLTAPVTDLAGVIDPASASELDKRIRVLQATTKDAIVVVTVKTIAPYGSIEEYAVKLFEQAGVGQRNQDNGALIVFAQQERRVRIEVGYGLEEFITDGFAGDVIRQQMLPAFREGRFGAGLLAGASRLIDRIAEKRGVKPVTPQPAPHPSPEPVGGIVSVIVAVVIVVIVAALRGNYRGPRGRRGPFGPWGPWSGWSGGAGPFGSGGFGSGGFGGFGGFGGGGGGGGFGGFGGGRSGGGGASGGW